MSIANKDGSLNRQVAFDMMVRGLAAQGWVGAANERKTCVLFEPRSGRKCAIGHLVPKGSYRATLEFLCPLAVLCDVYADQLSYQVSGDAEFLNECQGAHDSACSPSDMKRRFLDLAVAYSLAWPEDVACS